MRDRHPTGQESVRERLLTDVHGLVKPLLRGRIHALAFALSIPAGALLVANAAPGRAFAGALVYALSLTALYGVSSAYHRLGRTVRSQRWLRRLDHATIYVLIAGTYTPICLLVLQGATRWSLLVGVWLAAAVGAAIKLARFDGSHWLGSVLYGAMGWAAIVAVPQLVTRLPAWVLGLLGGGGLVYSVGALVLARRWPDPRPRVFGYHEIWHTLVVVAGICHYAAVFHVVRTPPV
jgi:hemolysin III